MKLDFRVYQTDDGRWSIQALHGTPWKPVVAVGFHTPSEAFEWLDEHISRFAEDVDGD